MLERQLAGNHLDRKAVERSYSGGRPGRGSGSRSRTRHGGGEVPLWLVAPTCPVVGRSAQACALRAGMLLERSPAELPVGAANELLLLDELVPFLLARSRERLMTSADGWRRAGRLNGCTMLGCLLMSMPTREELLQRFGPVEDPEIETRRQHILRVLLEQDPKMRQQLIDTGIEKGLLEGRLTATRASLRRVLARRLLAPSKDDDARIDACTDPATLERWLDRTITAVSISDVLG
jgi:hypothetical protein